MDSPFHYGQHNVVSSLVVSIQALNCHHQCYFIDTHLFDSTVVTQQVHFPIHLTNIVLLTILVSWSIKPFWQCRRGRIGFPIEFNSLITVIAFYQFIIVVNPFLISIGIAFLVWWSSVLNDCSRRTFLLIEENQTGTKH